MNASIMPWILAAFGAFSGLTGGGNELLDYLSTDAYWKSKDVVVSVATMRNALLPPAAVDVTRAIADLGSEKLETRERATQALRDANPSILPELVKAAQSPDSEVAQRAAAVLRDQRVAATKANARRLMAIRTLGEMRAREAEPALTALLKSTEPFVADAADEALAALRGRSAPRPHAGGVSEDLWLLPENCSAVAQIAPGNSRHLNLDELAGGASKLSAEERDTARGRVTAVVTPVVEQVGNVRFDSVTVGLSDDLNGETGFAVAIVRGKFDRNAIAALLDREVVPYKTIDGFKVYEAQQLGFFLPSDDRVVFFAGKDAAAAKIVARVRAGPGGLRQNEAMVRLLGTIDRTRPIWAAARNTAAYRTVIPNWAAHLDTVTVVGDRTATDTLQLAFRVTATPGHDKSVFDGVSQTLGAISNPKLKTQVEGNNHAITGSATLQYSPQEGFAQWLPRAFPEGPWSGLKN